MRAATKPAAKLIKLVERKLTRIFCVPELHGDGDGDVDVDADVDAGAEAGDGAADPRANRTQCLTVAVIWSQRLASFEVCGRCMLCVDCGDVYFMCSNLFGARARNLQSVASSWPLLWCTSCLVSDCLQVGAGAGCGAVGGVGASVGVGGGCGCGGKCVLDSLVAGEECEVNCARRVGCAARLGARFVSSGVA